MAKYTVELQTLLRDPTFQLFDFEYDFYTDISNVIRNFEKKFIQTYYFHEIGQECVHRFKWMLKAKLDNMAPYYQQIYITELKSKDIEFLLNKDYTETLIKENTSNNDFTQRSSINNDTNVNNNAQNTTNTNANYKESNLANGVSDVNLKDGLTAVTNNTDNVTDNSTNNMTSNSTNNANVTGNDSTRQNENYKLTGKGNIGTTSSATLLKEWRDVLINIDMMIIEDCRELFMQIY